MSLQILRAADYVVQPWKNGGGTTREIAVEPMGADLASFDWRVSLAEVAEGGPFSIFPGVDRVLSVLEGQLTLAFADTSSVTLNDKSQPLAFPADINCEVSLVGGPAVDLNIMIRRDRCRATVERLADRDWEPAGDVRLLFALGPVEITDGSGQFSLGRHDAALSLATERHSVRSLAIRGPSIAISLWSQER